jgi:hypothetical protein
MLGSVVSRERLPLWALVSFVVILGFAVSTLLADAAHDAALDSVVQRGRHASTLVTATVSDKELADPLKGASYEKLATRFGRSVAPDGSSVDVTVWSSRGQILFSLDKPLVGTKDLEMRPLISAMANGSGSYRISDGSVRAFVPVPLATKERGVLVEVDEPLTVVEARVGDVWSILRLAFTVVLAVSLLLLGLSFVSSINLARSRRKNERADGGEGHEERSADASVEARTDQPVAAQPAENLLVTEPRVSEHHASEEPVAELSASDQPVAEQPTADQPVTGKVTASFTQALEALEALQPNLGQAVHQDGAQKDQAPAVAAVPDEVADATEEEVRQAATAAVEAPDAVDPAVELMRKRREELKARAAKAELRVKKPDAELEQAGSGPRSEQ